MKGVYPAELGYVAKGEFGEIIWETGVEIAVVDNDRKAHSRIVRNEWPKFEIKV